jgi:ureidoacrylate peracid hydrolase
MNTPEAQGPHTVPAVAGSSRVARVAARPEPIEIALERTALVVVDMQNAYASPGGYRDLAGKDVGPAAAVVAHTRSLLAAARQADLTVVFLQNGWDPELKGAGGEGSPNWYKSNPLKLMRTRHDLSGRILTHGTWDHDFVSGLEPAPGDFVVPKCRYSGFSGTGLDALLRSRGIRYLLFAGIASNVCVESTLRDAFHLEYFCVFVRDATQASGPAPIQDAVVYTIETFLGWTTDTASLCSALALA